MSVLSKFNKSVKAGIEAGRIDKDRNGAVIEAAKKIAKIMDSPDWPIVNEKFDNVYASLFLKYCETLGITDLGPRQQAKEEKPLSLVGNSKWRKQA